MIALAWRALLIPLSVILIACFATLPSIAETLRSRELTLFATLLTAACGVTAAVLAALGSRLEGESRLGWLAAALGCYGLIAVPVAAAGLLDQPIPTSPAGIQTAVHIVVAALLIVAATGAAPLRGSPVHATTAIVLSVLGGVVALSLARPYTITAVLTSMPLRVAEALGWLAAMVTVALWAARQRSRALRLGGIGLGVLCAVHVGEIGAAHLPADLVVTLPLLRLAAVTVTLLALGRLAHRMVANLSTERAVRDEELRIARLQLSRTAERDHELRSGLAGLAGATRLLRAEHVDPNAAELGSAVVSELSRLDDLLRVGIPGPSEQRPAPVGYAVTQVLSGLVALRRSAGMSIELLVEPGLRAVGSSTVLAQVVTNLLGNAAVHAPGSPVRITAYRAAARVVIRVRDFGPGIPPGQEATVFERGVADKRHGGSGLGLHLCRRLLAAEGGTVAVSAAPADHPGCAIIVRVPAAGSVGRAREPLMISGAP